MVAVSVLAKEMHNSRNAILLIIICTVNKDGVNDGGGDDNAPRTSQAADLGRISLAES